MALYSLPGVIPGEHGRTYVARSVEIKHPEDEKIDPVKQRLGKIAANQIKDGWVVGLGTGSTATEFIKSLAQRCKEGLKITACASSNDSFDLAKKLGIEVYKIEEMEKSAEKFLDAYVDGADEVDENFNMIKGRGGALLREKILAQSSKKVIIMINRSKKVKQLGHIKLPVEVTRFGHELVKKQLELYGSVAIRTEEYGFLYMTDNGNFILDIQLTKLLRDPMNMHCSLKTITGVVDTGIFVGLVDQLIIGDESSSFDIIDVKKP